ncbi:cupin domain-containing protein [Streptomyces sp. 8L]|uniref:cupin domain-containing protein n=1 Tax=Streptomyces sp. 8L TaxID=2877242 RepID=UPI001CD59615|nr:cupin domain-containing protein [Streptomyces sp. 8L]MCA1216950.1 cupin domain-containing protein [Streptomyces sp. 8L]
MTTGSTRGRPFPPAVLRPGQRAAIDRGNGARTTPLVDRALGATGFLNGITAFEPGAAIGHHLHNCPESVMVIEGEAVVDIDGQETPLRPFDVTFVPANIPHHFRNASASRPMRIFWTYASVDATRAPAAGGPATRIDVEQETAGGTGRDGVTECVDLHVRPGAEDRFEARVAEAAALFQRAVGCRSFELVRSVEDGLVYHLLIEWSTLDDHLVGFRTSEDFAHWRELVMPLLTAPPQASHVRHILKSF